MTDIPAKTHSNCLPENLANRCTRKADAKIEQHDVSSFKWLFRLRQPAHLVTLLFAGYFTSLVLQSGLKSSPTSSITNILYLGSFACHFGAQMWMTFISGIVLFFTIPRHIFGLVQEQLFPKYFLLNSALAFITLTTFVQKYSYNVEEQQIQVLILGANFFLELITWLYLVPPILSIMKGRSRLEKSAGVGSEIGRHDSGPLRHCPFHGRLHKCFRRLHRLAAVANMTAIACNALHLYHLANKLCDL